MTINLDDYDFEQTIRWDEMSVKLQNLLQDFVESRIPESRHLEDGIAAKYLCSIHVKTLRGFQGFGKKSIKELADYLNKIGLPHRLDEKQDYPELHNLVEKLSKDKRNWHEETFHLISELRTKVIGLHETIRSSYSYHEHLEKVADFERRRETELQHIWLELSKLRKDLGLDESRRLIVNKNTM